MGALTKQQTKVLRYVQNNYPVTGPVIARSLNIAKSSTYYSLNRLLELGVIEAKPGYRPTNGRSWHPSPAVWMSALVGAGL
jgi:predicted transcriptional regulator